MAYRAWRCCFIGTHRGSAGGYPQTSLKLSQFRLDNFLIQSLVRLTANNLKGLLDFPVFLPELSEFEHIEMLQQCFGCFGNFPDRGASLYEVI